MRPGQTICRTRLDRALARHRATSCAVLFAMLALAQCLFFAFALPPFQGADEGMHVLRAAAIAEGRLTGRRLDDGGIGGPADPALVRAVNLMNYLPFDPAQKVAPGTDREVRAIGWTGERASVAFPNAVVGSPALYLPASAGLAAGRALGLGVVDSVTLARLLNVAACLALGFAAIRLAGAAAPFFLVVLGLPMSTYLAAYVTPDGMILCLSALAVALLTRAMRREGEAGGNRPDRRPQKMAFAGALAALALVGLAKAPYLFLLPLLLCASAIAMRWRFAALLAGAAPGIAWHVAVARLGLEWPGEPARQLAYLAANLTDLPAIARETLAIYGRAYVHEIGGVFGWLDTHMPWRYVRGAWLALIGAVLLVAVNAGNDPTTRRLAALPHPLLPLTSVLLSAGAIFGSLYLIWSPVGAGSVGGVQGRYFLPLFPPLALVALGAVRGKGLRRRLAAFAWPTAELLALFAFASASLYYTVAVVTERYYG